MIKLAVCDDERRMCAYLRDSAVDCFAKNDIDASVKEFHDGDSLVHAYENEQEDFDIVFLDIKMKNMNGISAAKEIRRLGARALIVFITSSAEYVFRGYEVKAFRYILKNELATSFERILRECIAELRSDGGPVFSFSSGRDSYSLPLSDILYFESERRVVTVHTKGGSYPFYEKLSDIEAQLSGTDFARCHQSFLVNAACIKNISGLTLTLTDSTTLPISKSKLKSTKEAFLWAMR